MELIYSIQNTNLKPLSEISIEVLFVTNDIYWWKLTDKVTCKRIISLKASKCRTYLSAKYLSLINFEPNDAQVPR